MIFLMSQWWNSALVGVIIGGLIVTITQFVIHWLAARGKSQERWFVLRGSSRVLRDDMRAVEARIAIALPDGKWWSDEELAPPLHRSSDVRALSAAISNPLRWGKIATSRRVLIRIEARRAAGREFDARWLAASFWQLEEARVISARDIERFSLKRIEWAPRLKEMFPDLGP